MPNLLIPPLNFDNMKLGNWHKLAKIGCPLHSTGCVLCNVYDILSKELDMLLSVVKAAEPSIKNVTTLSIVIDIFNSKANSCLKPKG